MCACVLSCAGLAVGAAMGIGAPQSAQIVPATDRATVATASSPRTASDQQLRAAATTLERATQGLGTQLLDSSLRHDDAVRERDAALDLLATWAAARYQSGMSDDPMIQILGSGGIARAADQVRMLQVMGDYRARLVTSLDEAEAALGASQLDRAQLVAKLDADQRRLSRVHDEIERRQSVRADAKEARLEQAAAKARSASATTAGTGSLVGFAGASSAVPTGPISAQMLDAYLAGKGSPMAGHGAAFIASGARWSVDPRVVVAIAGAESSFGQNTCGPNNAWGWACPNDPESFATWDAGIETITSGLRRYYLDEGRTSVVLIQQKYAPSNAANDPTGLNLHWVGNVSKFLIELGGDPMNVGPSGSATKLLPDLGGLGLIGD